MRSSVKKNSTKVLASIAVVAAAAGIAGMGTFGAFTSTTAADQEVGAGVVKIGLTQHATAGTNVKAVGLVPGDTVQRAVTLTRDDATESFGSVRLTTTATTPANLLTTDAAKGLQLAIDSCATPWTVSGKALTCANPIPVLARRAVIGENLDLTAATTALNGEAKAANLRFTLTLPEAAGNEFQGLNSTLNLKFDATQRAAAQR